MQENTETEKAPEKAAAPKKSVVLKYFEDLHAADGKLTRIPIEHLYFAENIDHSRGWENQMSNAACFRPGKQKEGVQRYHVADWIPAWQMVEWTIVSGPESVPVTEYVPIAHVRRWRRFT